MHSFILERHMCRPVTRTIFIVSTAYANYYTRKLDCITNIIIPGMHSNLLTYN